MSHTSPTPPTAPPDSTPVHLNPAVGERPPAPGPHPRPHGNRAAAGGGSPGGATLATLVVLVGGAVAWSRPSAPP